MFGHVFDGFEVDILDISFPSTVDVGDGVIDWVVEEGGLAVGVCGKEREFCLVCGEGIAVVGDGGVC